VGGEEHRHPAPGHGRQEDRQPEQDAHQGPRPTTGFSLGMVILVDDQHRENEGDLMCASAIR